MKAIAAVDANWGIGKDNKLLASIPEDMRFFKTTTMGNVVVMGRKTLESFPGSKPLKNRVNVVLTRNRSYHPDDVIVIHDIGELQSKIDEGFPEVNGDEVYVIGGASVYKELIDQCEKVYITKIDKAFDADAFFPCLDDDPKWKVVYESDEKTYEDMTYKFVTYKNTEIKK